MRLAVCLLAVAACSDSPNDSGNTIAFDPNADLTSPDHYWDYPYPSDTRLAADGTVDFTGFPNTRSLPIVNDLLTGAKRRAGFPTMPIAYFRFIGTVPQKQLGTIDPNAIIVDIDDASPEKGTKYPTVAQSLADDMYTGHGLVAVAPYPGLVLRAHTKYSVVLTHAFAPQTTSPAAWTKVVDGIDDQLVSTEFTTGDEGAVLQQRSDAIKSQYHVTIDGLHATGTHADFCELVGTVTMPQFQLGTQPFDTQGNFALDGNGVPMKQGDMTIPVTIVIPNGTMPAGGWPLWQFFHGSGGASTDLVDDGPTLVAGGTPTPGEGPGAVVARRGIASVSSAMPLNPERMPTATEFEYLNFSNLSSFPYTFQQGVFEQRMLLDAVQDLQIPAATVASCANVAQTAHFFDKTKLVAGGHSMGGMYTNMVASVEPRYGALTPFGAGGFWNLMILETAVVPGGRGFLATILSVDAESFTFVHPTLGLLAQGWEIADPLTSMARINRRPLPGMAKRFIYEPVGENDEYFPNDIYDAAALAYGNKQAGDQVWPTMQTSLAVDHLDGMVNYPESPDRRTSSASSCSTPATGSSTRTRFIASSTP
ncbi:MAG: hypothetical protein QM831_10120 [Kofleriaceae bacterium]